MTVARGRGVENPDNFVDVMCEWCHGCAAQSANAKKERRERGKTDGRRKEIQERERGNLYNGFCGGSFRGTCTNLWGESSADNLSVGTIQSEI